MDSNMVIGGKLRTPPHLPLALPLGWIISPPRSLYEERNACFSGLAGTDTRGTSS
jgi:hypothetical protein